MLDDMECLRELEFWGVVLWKQKERREKGSRARRSRGRIEGCWFACSGRGR